MPTTANLALPYPSGTDAPDGPGAFAALANAVDALLGRAYTPANPTFGNVGGMSAAGEYMLIGRHVHYIGSGTLQSGGSVGGLITMTVPVAKRAAAQSMSGRILALKPGNQIVELVPIWNTSTQVALQYQPGGSAALAATSAGAPFAWAAGDQILFDVWYAVD